MKPLPAKGRSYDLTETRPAASECGDAFILYGAMIQGATLIGVPFDLGASRAGSRLGPHAIRACDLAEKLRALGVAVHDAGDLELPTSADGNASGPGQPKNLAAVVAANRAVANAVEVAMREGSFPVILGGDHSLAIGAIAGIARINGPQGVIWIDAHPDVNTLETTPSGNIHGMSMAAALGALSDLFPPPDFPTPAADVRRLVFVGLRSVDEGERSFIHDRGITCYTMTDIDRLGMAHVIEQAIEIAGNGPSSVHVSFDIDSLDPMLAPGTGTPVPGGLTYREAHLAMELVAQSGIAHSLELTEVNPSLDDHDVTAKVAVELICSALGKRIL